MIDKHNSKLKFILSILIMIFFASCKLSPKIKVNIKNLETSRDSIRSFTIHNTGSSNLKILDFTTSCECTAVNLTKNAIIKPSDSLIVITKISQGLQNDDNIIFVTIKTNAIPQLCSFQFKP